MSVFKNKIFIWVIVLLVMVTIILEVVLPFFWLMSPSGAVRTRILRDGHPTVALTCNPTKTNEQPSPGRTLKSPRYEVSDNDSYESTDGSFTVFLFVGTKQGNTFKATPVPIEI